MIKKLRSLELRYRIIFVVGIILICIIGAFSAVISRTFDKYEKEVFGKESLNTLHSLDTSIQSMIKSADNYSKMLISDDNVQHHMSSGNLYANTQGQQQIIKKAYSVLQFSETSDVIWIIDQCGQKLKVGGATSSMSDTNENKYASLRTPYGRSKVMLETGKNGNFLSLVRAYNSLTDFSCLGIIGVDISMDRFNSIVSGAVDVSKETILVLNEDNNIIFWNAENGLLADYLALFSDAEFVEGELFKQVNINGREMMMSGICCEQRDWKILRFTPLPLSVTSNSLIRINLFMVIVIGVLMLLAAYFLTELLTKPIQSLLVAMGSGVDKAPAHIDEIPALDEFKSLYEGYNSMVGRIDQLLNETIERQKRIRQVELNEIQEQMKPHFLYNTLDAIEALAMMGDTATVCKLIEALGGFYRKSVSGGRELLTIKEEMEMAKDYAEIMHIRFGDTFMCEITYDGACAKYLIPKLTIQPLVENAFQHGIRGRITYGHVNVSAYLDDNKIHIIVDDNGTGIPKDVVRELENNISPGKQGSLGLRGTIMRLKLVYGESFGYEIGIEGASRIHMWIACDALEEIGDE